MKDPVKQAELSKELRSARNALLAVGIIMFAMDMIFIQGVYHDRLDAHYRNLLTAGSATVLAVFVVLAIMLRRAPRLCMWSGLIVFWGIQAFNMAMDPKSIGQGVVLKIIFTMALVKGIKAAGKASMLQHELLEVFE